MLDDAFAADGDDFGDDDWQHALGGMHFIVDLAGDILAHGSVVERELSIRGVPLRTGYVEAIATAPAHQRKGLGTRVMAEVSNYILEQFELGALGTGRHHFYERFNWQTWRGPSSVRSPHGDLSTPDEDGYIMVLTTPATPPIDITFPISCDFRSGDAW